MEKLRKLTEMTEHPDRYTEKEWEEVFDGEQVSQQLIDEEWEKFERKHFRRPDRQYLKIAAMFIGILVVSGIAMAAIFLPGDKKPETVAPEERTVTAVAEKQEKNPASAVAPHVVVFENTELQQVVDSLSAYYQVKPGYRHDSVRHLRLYYEWDQHNSIEEITGMLNNFEQVNISLQGDSIIIE